MYYVGIDWADQKNDIVILNESGAIVVKHLSIKKNQKGFEKLLDLFRGLSTDPQDFKLGIETPNNLLVDYFVDLGYPVYTIFPGSMKSFRKRYRSSGARDDEFDAFVISNVLRTDKDCWRKVDFGSDLVREIRILTQDHHQLADHQTALVNRLRSTLKEYYPEYIHFFSDVACLNSLVFIQAYPNFKLARELTLEQLSAFFKENKLCNGKKVNKIYDLLHQEHLWVPDTLVQTKMLKAISCARELMGLRLSIETYTNLIEKALHQHPDHKIFLSYPGVGTILAARLIAIFGDNRNLYADAGEVQALSGTCPVSEKSGKGYYVIYYRRACNKFYKDILHNLAFTSLKQAEWAKSYYDSHRQMGKKHNHALRCLGNLHVRILFAMWQNRTEYDENIFLAQKTRFSLKNNNNKSKKK